MRSMIRLAVLAGLCAMLTAVVVEAQFMFATPHVIDSPAFKKTVDGAIADTFDATPKVLYSIPVPANTLCFITAVATATDISGGNISAGAAGRVEGLCARASGNVNVLASNPALILSTFSAPQPSLSLVANVGTQSIDVVATGKAQWLRWNVDLEFRLSK